MTPDDVLRAAEVVEQVANRFDAYTLSGTARRAMRNSGEDLRWLLRQADFLSTLDPVTSQYIVVDGDLHEHRYKGQVLTHSHPSGEPHGYFNHPEDPT